MVRLRVHFNNEHPKLRKRRGKQPRRRLRGFGVRSQKYHSGHTASSGLWRVYEGRNRSAGGNGPKPNCVLELALEHVAAPLRSGPTLRSLDAIHCEECAVLEVVEYS